MSVRNAHLAYMFLLCSCRLDEHLSPHPAGRRADASYWVVLPEERCIGQNFFALREFCIERGLSLSRHGRTIPRREGYYQVFMFAEEADAEIFSKEFDGKRMCATERLRPRKLK